LKSLATRPAHCPHKRAFGGRRTITKVMEREAKMKKKYYIAYGSNLNISQMNMRCPQARFVGKGELDGYRLLFRGSKTGSYLTIEQKKGYSVPIVIWLVSENDVKMLDRYEGYPTFYYKENLKMRISKLKTKEKRDISAFVYIMHEERPIGVPSKAYMEACLEGYKNFKLDSKILMRAYEESKEAAK